MKVRSIRKTFVFGAIHFGTKVHNVPPKRTSEDQQRPRYGFKFKCSAVGLGKGRKV